MKIKSAQADPGSLPHPLDHVQVRATRSGVVVQRRPKPSKTRWSPAQRAQRLRFGFAARMASNPISLDLRTAIEMARGTEQVPRDILTMAALGRYYELVNADGTRWTHVAGATIADNAPPTSSPTPKTKTSRWDAMNWNAWDAAWEYPNDTNPYAFKGARFTPAVSETVQAVAAILNVHAGGVYRAAIGTADAAGVIQTLSITEPKTAAQSGHRMMHFDLEAELEAGVEAFYLIGRTDQAANFALGVYHRSPARWLWPCYPGNAVLLAQTTPATGQSLFLWSNRVAAPFGMSFAPRAT